MTGAEVINRIPSGDLEAYHKPAAGFRQESPAQLREIAILRPKKVVPSAALGYGGGRSANRRDQSHAA
jgi:hypothetical protein